MIDKEKVVKSEVSEREEKILEFWEKHQVFEKSQERRRLRPPFLCQAVR